MGKKGQVSAEGYIKKHKINVAVDKKKDLTLRSVGTDMSGFINEIMMKEAQRIKAENRQGMEDVARFIEQYGSFADESRHW
ncbi:MAG: type II toxin-antitoxin system CcdA family antitoxin [Enterobacteriaceae bacterium]|jgi:post-segregation antitoxin (ccd killing protein)|nr:type II toxin-antitoxin system CcdA family antitoxin [Enterobacteriaceae bacterium]